MTRFSHRRRFAPLFAIALGCMAALTAPAPVLAMQILDAADHAELSAEISATGVNRIALAGDRIARVVRAPDGFAVEHDAVSGDLYLRLVETDPGEGGRHAEASLFVGTERGFTYRLTLIPADRDSAQILIRNAAVHAGTAGTPGVAGPAAGTGPHIAALVRLVRAVARRETLPGYAIARGGGVPRDGLTLIETWRGSRLAALVFEAVRPASADADGGADLAGTIGGLPGMGHVAALWMAAPGTGPSGGRLVVAVTEAASAGDPR
jgi:hypothetical protein